MPDPEPLPIAPADVSPEVEAVLVAALRVRRAVSLNLLAAGWRVRLTVEAEAPAPDPDPETRPPEPEHDDARPEGSSANRPRNYSPPCAAKILELLAESKRRLTTTEFVDAFRARKWPWGATPITHTLSVMRKEGRLSHARDDDWGHGYGLPGWAAGPDGERLSEDCAADVLKLLRETGRRMTLTEIQDAFAAKEVTWSVTTVNHTCPAMRRAGRLTNRKRPDERGRGYGPPEWGPDDE